MFEILKFLKQICPYYRVLTITNYNRKQPEKFLRGIVNKIECEYYKKARGVLTASCKIEKKIENTLVTEIFNKDNDIVCKVWCNWDIKIYDKTTVNKIDS